MKSNSRHVSDEAKEVTGLERQAKAVILYDILDSMLAANQLLAGVPSDGAQPAEWMVNSWRFDMLTLQHQPEACQALRESVDAELVVLAIGDPASWAGLPVKWLGLWWDCRSSKAARLMVMPFDQVTDNHSHPESVDRARWLTSAHRRFLSSVGLRRGKLCWETPAPPRLRWPSKGDRTCR